MTRYYVYLWCFIIFSTPLFGQKKSKNELKKSVTTSIQRLPDSLYQELSKCNGVDVVLFLKGKSMEFADKNAKAPVSFIGSENASSLEGYKHIGLYTFKINGSVFLDCDILLNDSGTEALMRFKNKSQQIYYRKMNANGLNILLQWIK